MEELTDAGSTWSVRDDALARYVELAADVSWRDLAAAAEWTATPNGALSSLRDAARLNAGLQLLAGSAVPDAGWPSDVPRERVAAFAVHDRLAIRAVGDVAQAVNSAASADAIAAQQLCVVCAMGCRVHDAGSLAGLCSSCMSAARHVSAIRDAATAGERVGGRMRGKSRGELVTEYLSSHSI